MAKPVKTIKYGCVSINVFENIKDMKGEKVTVQSFQVQKCYKDKSSDEFKYTSNFATGDLVKLMLAVQEALMYAYGAAKETTVVTDDIPF